MPIHEILFFLQIRYSLLQEGDLLAFEGCFFIDPEQSLCVIRLRQGFGGQARSTVRQAHGSGQAFGEAHYQLRNSDCGM
jgi:hypothetical protein